MFNYFVLCAAGISFGALSAAGVFTVLVAIGLVPRFAGKTHTSSHVLLYEEMVVLGTIVGSFFSIFPEYSQLGAFIEQILPGRKNIQTLLGQAGNISFGLFCGMFVGCLALAIAEMLDSIPIFARRVRLKKGIGLAVFSMAIGKLAGSLYYFVEELFRSLPSF